MHDINKDVARPNLTTFDSPGVIRSYATSSSLMKNESLILSRLRPGFIGKKILEIGVGGGRLTPALLEISENYIGIDWSEKMIARCRERFPHVCFMVCDTRDLSRFESESIDLIVFAFNGIDYVDHAGRIRALREIHRVCSDKGVFVFSSHNRRSKVETPWQLIQPWRVKPFRHPRSSLKIISEFLICCINQLRNRGYQEHHDECAILNDQAHNYSLMTYYIEVEKQVDQLKRIAFEGIEVVDFDGNLLSEIDYATCRDTWIYYICRKSGSETAG